MGNSFVNKMGEEVIKKLNLYTILQALWLTEMYYLGVNSVYNIANERIIINKIKVPSLILKYNDLILNYFKDFSDFVMFLSIALFICGLSIIFIRFIPKLSDYNLLYCYSDYGFTSGMWLFLIYGTYELYSFIGIFFLITPILVFGVTELFKKMSKKFNLYDYGV